MRRIRLVRSKPPLLRHQSKMIPFVSEQISAEAIEELGKLPGNNEFLEQLIHVLINRQK